MCCCPLGQAKLVYETYGMGLAACCNASGAHERVISHRTGMPRLHLDADGISATWNRVSCTHPRPRKRSFFHWELKSSFTDLQKHATGNFQLALGGQNVNNPAGCSFLHQTLMEGLMLRHVNPPSPNPEKFLSVYCICLL